MSGNSFEPCFNMPSSTPWACPGAPRWALASTCEHACSSSACRMPCLSTRITKCPPGYALVNHVGHGGPLELFQPPRFEPKFVAGASMQELCSWLLLPCFSNTFGGHLWQKSFPISFLKPIPPDRFPSIRSWGPEPPPERQRSPLPLLRFHSKISIGLDSLLEEQSHNLYNPNSLSPSWQAQKSSLTKDNQRLQFGSKISIPASWTIKTTPHKLAIAGLIKKDWIPRSSLKNAMKTNVSRKDRLKVCFMNSKEWIVKVRFNI